MSGLCAAVDDPLVREEAAGFASSSSSSDSSDEVSSSLLDSVSSFFSAAAAAAAAAAAWWLAKNRLWNGFFSGVDDPFELVEVAEAAAAARLRTAGAGAGAGAFSTSFCLTSLVVNGAPVLATPLAEDEAELSEVLESLLADRADLTWAPVAAAALLDALGCSW